MISKGHSNRDWHNWLIYEIGDRCLQRHAQLYRGVVYDLGAGEAPYRAFFEQYAERYVTVDWAGSAHDTRAEISADLNESLPVESGTANTVVSLSVLEHLHDPRRMLAEAFRILGPGGAIVLQVPWQWQVHEEPYDYFRYTPYALDRLLAEAGFTAVSVEAQAGYFTTAILKWNYFTRRFVAGPAPLRSLLRIVLAAFWYIGQKLAPLLDKLDRNWEREAPGFFVTARKP